MSDLSETKVCPFCAETIKAAAKLCPFCRSQQKRFQVWLPEFSVGLVGLGFAILAVFFSGWVLLGDSGVGGRSFSGHRNDLIVFGSRLSWRTNNSKFWLSGLVTNEGVYSWRVHELEVRFLDNQTNLLEVRHPEFEEKFVVQPGQDHAFQIDLGRLIFTNVDVPLQVRVQNASDGDRPWKSD